MSEGDFSDHPVSVVVIVVVAVSNVFTFLTSHKRICFKFCVDVTLNDPY